MVLNFNCKRCHTNYDFEVGRLTFDENGDGALEVQPNCPRCRSDQWLLSELGQSQATAVQLSDLPSPGHLRPETTAHDSPC